MAIGASPAELKESEREPRESGRITRPTAPPANPASLAKAAPVRAKRPDIQYLLIDRPGRCERALHLSPLSNGGDERRKLRLTLTRSPRPAKEALALGEIRNEVKNIDYSGTFGYGERMAKAKT